MVHIRTVVTYSQTLKEVKPVSNHGCLKNVKPSDKPHFIRE